MNWKTWAPLILAIVLGVAAAKLVNDTIKKNKLAAAPTGKFTKVVVTKGDIEPGRELKVDDLVLANVDADKVPGNSFTDPAQLAGRVSETLMVKNQPVVEAMLAPTGSGSGLQALVPPGMRAISMEVNEFSGVAGLLTPGCRVDILATINDGQNGQQIARTIVQNVKVSAVGQKTSNGNEPPPPATEMFKSVTVLVSLADAEAIELACATGRPRLVLRGGRDNQVIATAGVSLGDLRGAASRGSDPFVEPVAKATPPATQPAATTQPAQPEAIVRRDPPRRVVKLIKGGVESSVTLNTADGSSQNAISDTRDPFSGN